LQTFALHASVPHRVCRPVAGDQQALPHLPCGHRDAPEQGPAVHLTVTGVPQGLRNFSCVRLPAVALQVTASWPHLRSAGQSRVLSVSLPSKEILVVAREAQNPTVVVVLNCLLKYHWEYFRCLTLPPRFEVRGDSWNPNCKILFTE
jgi:hypothetical protein